MYVQSHLDKVIEVVEINSGEELAHFSIDKGDRQKNDSSEDIVVVHHSELRVACFRCKVLYGSDLAMLSPY